MPLASVTFVFDEAVDSNFFGENEPFGDPGARPLTGSVPVVPFGLLPNGDLGAGVDFFGFGNGEPLGDGDFPNVVFVFENDGLGADDIKSFFGLSPKVENELAPDFGLSKVDDVCLVNGDFDVDALNGEEKSEGSFEPDFEANGENDFLSMALSASDFGLSKDDDFFGNGDFDAEALKGGE